MTCRAAFLKDRFTAPGLRIGVNGWCDAVPDPGSRREAGQADAFRPGCDSEGDPAGAVTLSSDRHNDVLPTAGHISDRATSGSHRQLCFCDHLPGRLVVGAQLRGAVYTAATEDDVA